MKIKAIYKYLKSRKYYDKLYDQIVEKRAELYEEKARNLAFNPTKKQLGEYRELLGGEEMSDEEVKDSSRNFMLFMSILLKQAVIQQSEDEREAKVKEWMDSDRKKDKRILNTEPLTGIKCSKCGKEMKYQWSELREWGDNKPPNEKVLFLYECPDKCLRRAFYEDGTPFISENKNLCPECKNKRHSVFTKDSEGNYYIISDCRVCGSKDVEYY